MSSDIFLQNGLNLNVHDHWMGWGWGWGLLHYRHTPTSVYFYSLSLLLKCIKSSFSGKFASKCEGKGDTWNFNWLA